MHKRIIYFVTIVLVLTGVYFLGVTKGYYQRISVQNFGLVFQQELNNYEDTVPNFGLYKTVMEIMRDKYYGDVDFLDVLYGSVDGAVQALDDPYTLFTTPEENEEFFSSLGGTYEGVGVEIDFTDGRLIVVAPLEGSPADLAGIRSGDEIVAIGGRLVIDLDAYTATNLIKGKRGT
ncbi:PDZ domain-containing protein, partial [Candidatus Babeliales bacterium]|nr:PDZ domain-containing protein [Candidatus Babeliales bacterium]